MGRKDLGTVLGEEDRALARVRLRLEDGARLGHGLAYDDRHVGLDDARLLVGYLGERVAEKLRVVHGDIRDDRELGRDDVRAVEAAAQSHFDDRDIHLLLGKILEGQAVVSSKNEGWSGSKKLRSSRTKSTTYSSGIITPLTRMRSRKSTR